MLRSYWRCPRSRRRFQMDRAVREGAATAHRLDDNATVRTAPSSFSYCVNVGLSMILIGIRAPAARLGAMRYQSVESGNLPNVRDVYASWYATVKRKPNGIMVRLTAAFRNAVALELRLRARVDDQSRQQLEFGSRPTVTAQRADFLSRFSCDEVTPFSLPGFSPLNRSSRCGILHRHPTSHGDPATVSDRDSVRRCTWRRLDRGIRERPKYVASETRKCRSSSFVGSRT